MHNVLRETERAAVPHMCSRASGIAAIPRRRRGNAAPPRGNAARRAIVLRQCRPWAIERQCRQPCVQRQSRPPRSGSAAHHAAAVPPTMQRQCRPPCSGSAAQQHSGIAAQHTRALRCRLLIYFPQYLRRFDSPPAGLSGLRAPGLHFASVRTSHALTLLRSGDNS